jgi:hypothetical protein
MPRKVAPECISDAFDLYVKYNGSNFPAIEREMRARGWTSFTKQSIRKKVKGEYVGWEIDLGWKNALKEINANRGKAAMTSAEGLHHEVETVRTTLFSEILTRGVNDPDYKFLLWEHGKYVAKTADILKSLDAARNNYANCLFFLKWLLRRSMKISPDLARALVEAEDALLDCAEEDFVTPEAPEDHV